MTLHNSFHHWAGDWGNSPAELGPHWYQFRYPFIIYSSNSFRAVLRFWISSSRWAFCLAPSDSEDRHCLESSLKYSSAEVNLGRVSTTMVGLARLSCVGRGLEPPPEYHKSHIATDNLEETLDLHHNYHGFNGWFINFRNLHPGFGCRSSKQTSSWSKTTQELGLWWCQVRLLLSQGFTRFGLLLCEMLRIALLAGLAIKAVPGYKCVIFVGFQSLTNLDMYIYIYTHRSLVYRWR